VKIRATHPYSYRSGQWAELLTTAPGTDRDCYVVQFPDGATDFWVVDDQHAGYEFDPPRI
jgi:hypothetical protein